MASGGTWEDSEEGGHSGYNPVGRGACNVKELDKGKPIPAPQLLAVGQEVPSIGDFVDPVGFAPLAPSWSQRIYFAGTYDDEWVENKHPLPPDDFNYAFYNAAHPDLIYDGFFGGSEEVKLTGFSHEGEIKFSLPETQLVTRIVNLKGHSVDSIANLDTLEIDVEEMIAHLVWRVFEPSIGSISAVLIMEQPICTNE